MAKPKKSFSPSDINEFLLNTLLGNEARTLTRQAKNVQPPQSGQGTVAQQFGSLGLGSETQKILAQLGLLGKAAASTNIADFFGMKDAYKALENKSPANAAWSALAVAPIAMPKALGKGFKKSAKEINLLASYLRNLFQQ